MKYKIGDKVRVREDLEARNFYGFYLNEEMAKLKGKVVEIKDVFSDSYSIKEDTYHWAEKMFSGLAEPRNLIPLFVKELGVEIGERFAIGPPDIRFYFDDNSLRSESFDGKENDFNYDDIFVNLINGKTLLSKLPPKQKLTEAERVILENLLKEYKYIKRTEYGLHVYDEDIGSIFEDFNMFNHLFQFIKEDKEPYKIQELLEEYENLRSE